MLIENIRPIKDRHDLLDRLFCQLTVLELSFLAALQHHRACQVRLITVLVIIALLEMPLPIKRSIRYDSTKSIHNRRSFFMLSESWTIE